MKSKTITSLMPFLFVWLWSTGFVGARFGLPYIEPFFMLGLRFAITIPCFIVLIVILRRRWLRLDQIKVQLVVGALLHGLYLGGVFYAVRLGTPAGIAAIIVGIQPILTALINRVLFAQSVTLRQTIGLVLGFAGLIAVIAGSAEISGSDLGMQGLITCLISLFGISISTIIQKRFAGETPLLSGVLWQYIGAIMLIGTASYFTETHVYTPAWQLFAAIGWLVLALSIGAILLLMYMIRMGEIAKVTSYFYLVPPVAVIQTWWLFGETLSLTSLIGCAVVVLGVALVVRN
ncbi:MAG: DMT family transporter [Rhodobacterales bacterium]